MKSTYLRQLQQSGLFSFAIAASAMVPLLFCLPCYAHFDESDLVPIAGSQNTDVVTRPNPSVDVVVARNPGTQAVSTITAPKQNIQYFARPMQPKPLGLYATALPLQNENIKAIAAKQKHLGIEAVVSPIDAKIKITTSIALQGYMLSK